MPHSGGGGSSSGGCHSSSHYSSSHHSSYRNGHKIVENRYVFYYKNKPHFYHSNKPYNKGSVRDKYVSMLLLGAFMCGIVAIVLMTEARLNSGPIQTYGVDTEILIDDDSNILSQEECDLLKHRLTDFADETGVIFSIVSSPYGQIGDGIEEQSYYEYISRFRDEQHWLIYYVGYNLDGCDYEWNLMCGDDCTDVLSTAQERLFMKTISNNILEGSSWYHAINDALDKLEPNTGIRLVERSNGKSPLPDNDEFELLLFTVIGVPLLIFGFIGMHKPLSKKDIAKTLSIKIDESDKCVTCGKCGGKYVESSVDRCPYCGDDFRN